MAQDYYTLEEAAAIVRMSPDDLKQMARKGELRSFQDRGTWRFRVPDIQELARARGVGSDPELVLGESPTPRPTDSPAPRNPGPRSPGRSREAEVFDFDLKADEESIGVGNEFLLETPGSGRKPGSSKSKLEGPKSGPKSGPRSGPKSPGPKSPSPKSPAPKPGSDSDVRLVAEGSDMDFQLAIDSDAKLVDDSGPPPQVKQRGRTGTTGPASPRPGKAGPASPRPGQPDAPKRRTGTTPDAPPVDSGVRLVPMDSDSDVRIVGPGSDESLPVGGQPPRSTSDSDIRLEKHQRPKPASDEGLLTEEINLDEELRKEEAQRKAGSQSKLRPRPQQPAPPAPAASPFELSDSDLNLPDESAPLPQSKSDKDSSSDFELTPAKEDNSPLDLGSSDLELTPAARSSSPLDPSSEEEFKLDLPDDDIGLGQLPSPSGKKGPDSGIRLDKPVDSGISLEQGGEGSDEIEFELSLDAENTPRPQSPAAQAGPADSDSEFELTLDADDAKPAGGDSSDFELTLDTDDSKPAAQAAADSDSEFELTLDDSGGLSPLEGDASPQVKADSDEKDIFETDFEVPTLDEDSGSEAVATEDADTGLDSSDFDLEISQEDMASADESASEVVALDDEVAPPAPRKGKKKAALARAPVADEEEVEAEVEPGFDDLAAEGGEVESEGYAEGEEGPARTVVKEKLLPAAPWGIVPVFFMSLCVPVMILVALLGFELVQGMNGHKTPGLVTRTITNLLPK